MKNWKLTVIALLAIFALPSCKATGDMVKVGEIDGLIRVVADRHDALINGTLKHENISEAGRATYLRSTAILRKVLDTAAGR